MKGQAERKPNGKANGGDDESVLVPPEKRCKYRTERGTPCRAARRKDSEYCIFHDRDFQRHRNEIKGARTMLDRRKKPERRKAFTRFSFATSRSFARERLSRGLRTASPTTRRS